MSGLSHMQIVDAITEVAVKIVPVLLAEEKLIHCDSIQHAETQIKVAVIEVLKQPDEAPTKVEQTAFWPDILKFTSAHNRLVFIALVRAIYD